MRGLWAEKIPVFMMAGAAGFPTYVPNMGMYRNRKRIRDFRGVIIFNIATFCIVYTEEEL